MPKKNPKHQAQIQRQQTLTKRGKRVYNWRKIGKILVACAAAGVFVTLGIVFGPQVFGRQIRDGDSVYIYYELKLANGNSKGSSTSADGNLMKISLTGDERVIKGFYDNVIGMREGNTKSFIIPACAAQNCDPYDGYTNSGDSELDWQELHYFVRIVRFA